MEQNTHSFFVRFYIYQKERFPFVGYIILIGVFTFSAISYSRICRGENGFIDWKHYLIGIITTFTLFFLVRIFDEFKDKEEDAKYRKYLPVPRGLISLKELRWVGILVALIQLFLILFFQKEMILLYFPCNTIPDCNQIELLSQHSLLNFYLELSCKYHQKSKCH